MHRFSTMNDTQLRQVQRKLEESRDEAFRFLARAQEERQFLDRDDAQDLMDRSVASSTREFLFRRSSQKRRLLQMVEDALRRIDNNEFGKCVNCGQRINVKRLEAMPWTEYCLQCQEKFEQVERVELPAKSFGMVHSRVQFTD